MTGDLAFYTRNAIGDPNLTERMRIFVDGNVGIGLGNPSPRLLHVNGNILANGTITPSDSRLKTNIASLNYGLSEILQLRPVSYHWKDKPNENLTLGLIAQETLSIIPEVVVAPASETEHFGMNYPALIPVLIKAMQEQQAQIEDLKTNTKILEQRLAAIEALLLKQRGTQTASALKNGQ